ncbi:cap-specific mRNA (nucleoside-2'-O-)-methyltransferase 2-like [Ptychodera flava]|uniref:cap-specific mRNA (nucleoside-2'-O-)-methyltransferase 2-like n=1 Tax=Ptychodera flava TaxID=63121 RepID=UPI00396A76D9
MGRKKKHSKTGNNLSWMKAVKYSEDIKTEVNQMFSKKFTFKKPTCEDQSWTLPNIHRVLCSDSVKQNEVMSELKKQLNATKSLLSDKDIEQWHEHTMFTNKAGRIVPQIRAQFKPELCTQAWCKFYEIICTYDILPKAAVESGQLYTVHLCEAPGAFITSLNQYLKRNNVDVEWNWIASTLNPYYEGNDLSSMIPDDRFIYGTLDHWYFGEDNTGDVTNVKLMMGLVESCKLSDVNLITADGSIDCQSDPAEQEALVSHLHYCEVITALQCLSPNGNFVLKMFTFFEQSSVSLMYLLNCAFQLVHVFKPATSKSGNSEVYVVCLNFLGKSELQEYFPKLVEKFGAAKSKCLFLPEDIPPSFTEQLIECAKEFKEYQCTTIDSNIKLHTSMSLQEKRHIEQVRDCCLQMYIERFDVDYIPREQQICPDLYTQEYYLRNQILCGNKTRHLGSFNDRRNEFHWRRHLEVAADGWILNEKEDFMLSKSVDLKKDEISDFKTVNGKCLKRIRSSRVSPPKLLSDFNTALDTAQVFHTENRQILDELLSSSNDTLMTTVKKIIVEDVFGLVQNMSDYPLSVLCIASKDVNDHVFGQEDVKSKVKLLNEVEDLVIDDTSPDPDLHISWLYRFGQGEYNPTVQLITATYPIMPCADNLTDLAANHYILYIIAASFKRLVCGGYLIFTSPVRIFHTRFAVGLLYLLQTCFEQVIVHCMSTFPSHCVISCQNYQPNVMLTEYVWSIAEELTCLRQSSVDDVRDIIEIVPMKYLYDHVFYKVVVQLNEYFLKTQLSNLVHMEKTVSSFNVSPNMN